MVDRSYHKDEVIQMYVDRGMVKWAPFATAELGAGWRDYQAGLNQKMKYSLLEREEIQTIFQWALLHSLMLHIEVKEGYETRMVSGFIKEWRDQEEVLFYGDDGHYEVIAVSDVICVQPCVEDVVDVEAELL